MIHKSEPANKNSIQEDLKNLSYSVYETDDEFFKCNYIHYIPSLPKWTDKKYFTRKEQQNLFSLECTCQDYKNKTKIFKDRDIRKLCKHLYWKLTETEASKHLDELTQLITLDAVFHEEWLLHRTTFKNRDMIIGYTKLRSTGWVNVYYVFYTKGWVKLAYNFFERNWRNGIIFTGHERIENHLNHVIQNEILKDISK